jgi:predicted transcriptional regulator
MDLGTRAYLERAENELGKPYEVVFRNLKYLEGIGLVELTKKANRKVPQMRHGLSINMFAVEGVGT